MKKTYRSLFCLLAVLLLSVSVLPSASALFSKKLYYYGTVEGVSRTVEGKVESILVSAEEQETYQISSPTAPSGRIMTKRPPLTPPPLR